MNGSEYLVRALRESGVDHIFGLPGDTGMAFYDSLYHEPEITHVMTRDERSASFMADVYARVSRRLGVCEGPSGGGATYIIPGVAEAQGSAVPLLCMTSDTPVSEDYRNVLTELDQVALFRPITKWSERVHMASGMEDAVARAIRLAVSDRPGAVHLSLPADVLEQEFDGPGRARSARERDVVPRGRSRADTQEVERAAVLIETAERPVIVAGGGVMISGAWDALTVLAETLNIPVATSINGKGAIAETSRCAIGVVGGNGARSYANQWIAESDLVVFVGTRTESTTTSHWTLPNRTTPPKMIQIDAASREIGNTYPVDAFLLGDARATLEDLLSAISDRSGLATRLAPRIDVLAQQRAIYWQDVDVEVGSESYPVKPQRLIATLRELMDDDTIIVADPGTPTPYLAAQYELRRAGRTTVIPRAYGGLGYAIPGVVGAHYAAPRKRIVGVTTDGSFGMSVGELETLSRLNLPIMLVHCSNGSFGWIKELQHLYHDQRYYSVDFSTVDYARIARGFGLKSFDVMDPADLKSTMQEALAYGGPTFVNVATLSQTVETPPVSGWEAAAKRGSRAGVAS